MDLSSARESFKESIRYAISDNDASQITGYVSELAVIGMYGTADVLTKTDMDPNSYPEVKPEYAETVLSFAKSYLELLESADGILDNYKIALSFLNALSAIKLGSCLQKCVESYIHFMNKFDDAGRESVADEFYSCAQKIAPDNGWIRFRKFRLGLGCHKNADFAWRDGTDHKGSGEGKSIYEVADSELKALFCRQSAAYSRRKEEERRAREERERAEREKAEEKRREQEAIEKAKREKEEELRREQEERENAKAARRAAKLEAKRLQASVKKAKRKESLKESRECTLKFLKNVLWSLPLALSILFIVTNILCLNNVSPFSDFWLAMYIRLSKPNGYFTYIKLDSGRIIPALVFAGIFGVVQLIFLILSLKDFDYWHDEPGYIFTMVCSIVGSVFILAMNIAGGVYFGNASSGSGLRDRRATGKEWDFMSECMRCSQFKQELKIWYTSGFYIVDSGAERQKEFVYCCKAGDTFVVPYDDERYSISDYNILSDYGITKVIFRDGTNRISGSLSNKSELTSITIPNSVTDISKDTFAACEKAIIYCEAPSKPDGWSDGWNGDCPVVWDYKNCGESDIPPVSDDDGENGGTGGGTEAEPDTPPYEEETDPIIPPQASPTVVEISTVEEFQSVFAGSLYSSIYRLTGDLDFDGIDFTPVRSLPAGKTFDGNGHTIRNVTITQAVDVTYWYTFKNSVGLELIRGVYSTGLFAANNGTIKNLVVENCNISYSDNVVKMHFGAVVGYSEGRIEQCKAVNCAYVFSGNSANGVMINGGRQDNGKGILGVYGDSKGTVIDWADEEEPFVPPEEVPESEPETDSDRRLALYLRKKRSVNP